MVYLPRDLKHDRLVALKMLHPELATALGPERFLREVHTDLVVEPGPNSPLAGLVEMENFYVDCCMPSPRVPDDS